MNILKKEREIRKICERPQTAFFSHFLVKNSEKKDSQTSRAQSHKNGFSQISLTSRPHAIFFHGDFCTFGSRDTLNHVAIWNQSKEKGRHTGESPAALLVQRTGVSRSDLPLFSTKQFYVMRDTNEPGQNLSNPNHAIYQIVEDLFDYYGTPQQIDDQLWTILVAAFNSKDFDTMTPLERANVLSLYRHISKLIFNLNPTTPCDK